MSRASRDIGTCRCITTGTSTTQSKTALVEPPPSSELSGWSVLGGVASPPLAHRRFGRRYAPRYDLWHGDVDNLLHGALLNALLWNQSHNFNDLRDDLRNVLNRHLRLAVWTKPPKITILISFQICSRRLFSPCSSEKVPISLATHSASFTGNINS